MKALLFLLSLILTDQLSKQLVVKQFYVGESLNILPVLDILLIFNTGIAFSLFDDGGLFGRWVLVILVMCVCLYLSFILISESLKKFEFIALLMILSGGLGNLIDRSFRGHVVDFIHVYYESYSFYIFNLADTFITIGVIIYILNIIIPKFTGNGNQVS